jgi:hypothetical protein
VLSLGQLPGNIEQLEKAFPTKITSAYLMETKLDLTADPKVLANYSGMAWYSHKGVSEQNVNGVALEIHLDRSPYNITWKAPESWCPFVTRIY